MQPERSKQLKELIIGLEHLLSWLDLDPRCQWAKHFSRMNYEAIQLRDNGFTQDQLNSLSTSIRSVYGGMGSFNDYCPPPMDKKRATWYKDSTKPKEPSSDVYELALALKVIDSY